MCVNKLVMNCLGRAQSYFYPEEFFLFSHDKLRCWWSLAKCLRWHGLEGAFGREFFFLWWFPVEWRSPSRIHIYVRTSAVGPSPSWEWNLLVFVHCRQIEPQLISKRWLAWWPMLCLWRSTLYFIFHSCNLLPRQILAILVTVCQKRTWPVWGWFFCWSLWVFR